MSAITIDSGIYDAANSYALKHNTNVREMVEKMLIKVITPQRKNTSLKDIPSELDLGGILAGVENKDDGTDERFHYLMEKYR